MSSISIITPVNHNDLEFVLELQILLSNQLHTDYEWIIVKDEDFSIPIYHTDITVKIFDNQFSNGVAGARNTGIKHATKDYIYFLDCDDIITEHTLLCLLETAEMEDVDIVLGTERHITKRPAISDSYRLLFDRLIKNRHVVLTEAKSKHLRLSSLNILFKKHFLLENNIKFDSELKLFFDIPFNCEAFEKANKIAFEQDAIYLKMERNDPIQKPSLKQLNEEDKIYEYPIAYKKAKDKITKSDLISILDRNIIKAYYYTYIRGVHNNSNNKKKQLLDNWSNALKKLEPESIRKAKKTAGLEIKLMRKNAFSTAKGMAFIRIMVNQIKKYKKNPLHLKVSIYNKLFMKIPVKENVILYESFLGRSFSDSPKYIYQYMDRTYSKKYKHVWVFNDRRDDLSEIKHKVKRFSLKYFYYLAISRHFVNNMRQPMWYKKREGQVFLQTWHGTPLKKLVFDMDDVYSANPKYKKDFFQQSRVWDYLISANSYSSTIFKRAFLFNNKMLEYGYPRNDILYAPDKDSLASEIKEKLGIPQDKKVVLYAPTWRDDEFYKRGQYKFKLHLDLKRLKNKLGNDYFFILRTHYFIADQLDLEGVEDVVYNGSNYDDIAELYLISDILMTDYSSVFFDFANLKRPILFFAYDLDKYKDTLRGFYLDHKTEWPGPILQTNDEVVDTLKNIEERYAPYHERLEEFYNKFCKWEDGNASKSVSEHVLINRVENTISIESASSKNLLN